MYVQRIINQKVFIWSTPVPNIQSVDDQKKKNFIGLNWKCPQCIRVNIKCFSQIAKSFLDYGKPLIQLLTGDGAVCATIDSVFKTTL